MERERNVDIHDGSNEWSLENESASNNGNRVWWLTEEEGLGGEIK